MMTRKMRAAISLLLLALLAVFFVAVAAVSPSFSAGGTGGRLVFGARPADNASLWSEDLIASLCPPPVGGNYRVALPQVLRQEGRVLQQPTIGPSPTATRTPTHTPTATLGPTSTPGPTLTATVTPLPSFRVEKVVWPDKGNIGTPFIFTIGLVNPLSVPVQVTLVDTLPEGLRLGRVWAPTGTVLLVEGNSFSVSLTVAHDWADNLFFCAVAEVPPCGYSCYVQNSAVWTASWAGGSGGGVASSQQILLINVTPTPTPLSPTLTPPIFPTWSDTATPTAGPSLTPTGTASPTVPAPTATRTPQPTLGPSPTPTPP